MHFLLVKSVTCLSKMMIDNPAGLADRSDRVVIRRSLKSLSIIGHETHALGTRGRT